jgi:ferritin
MAKALNDQIHAEFQSSYVYRAMQAFFVQANLDGFAHWMHLQAEEEAGHGERLFNYVHDRGGKVILAGLDAPKTNWSTPLQVMENALAHEKKVSEMIYDLVKVAKEENDYATQTYLNWFVTEQIEEEASVDRIVERMKLASDSSAGLLLIDGELASRAGNPGNAG